MEFTDSERKSYHTLVKKPLSMWVIVPGYFIASFIYIVIASTAELKYGFIWLGSDHWILPLVAFITLLAGQFAVSEEQRSLVKKLASAHPELDSESSHEKSSAT